MLHEPNLGHTFDDLFAPLPRSTDKTIDVANHLEELKIEVRALRDNGVLRACHVEREFARSATSLKESCFCVA